MGSPSFCLRYGRLLLGFVLTVGVTSAGGYPVVFKLAVRKALPMGASDCGASSFALGLSHPARLTGSGLAEGGETFSINMIRAAATLFGSVSAPV